MTDFDPLSKKLEIQVQERIAELEKANQELRAEILERKCGGEQLRYHASLIDNVSDAIISMDKDLKIQSWNKAAERIYGWQADEVIGLKESDVLPITFPKGLNREAITKDIFEKGYWEGELFQRTKGGKDIIVYAKSMVLKDEAGVIIGGVSISFDITEHKLAEETLKESEEKYRRIVETAQEGIWLIDQNDRTVFVNQKMSDMLGFSIDEILGQSPQKFMAPEFRIKAEDRLHEHMQGTMHVIDYRFVRKDGSNLWCILSSSPLFDNQGKYSGSLAMITDISERKKAEEILKKAHETLEEKVKERTAELEGAYKLLKENQRSLVKAQEIAHLGNWDWDLVTGEVYCSDELYRIFGYNSKEPIQYFDYTYRYVHPEDRDYVDNAIKEALKGKSIDVYHRIILDNGEERAVHAQIEVVFDKKNTPARMIGTIQDITERKKEENKICRYNRVLEGINRIFENVIRAETEEKLGNACLSVALKVTGGGIGFINLMGDDGLLHDTAISKTGWNQCLMYDKPGHRRQPGSFVLHGLYGHVVNSGKGFFTNDPQSHIQSIGVPYGHPPIKSFLGVPLFLDGKIIGMLGVANREGGYNYEQQEDLETISLAVSQAFQRKKEEQQRKQILETLRCSEDELRGLIQNVKSGIALVDESGKFVVVNPSFMQMFGLENELNILNVNSQEWSQWEVYGEDGKLLHVDEHPIRKAAITGEPVKNQLVSVRNPGANDLTWMQISAEPILKEDGYIYRVICTYHDITELKQIEEDLKKSEKQYRTLGDTIPYGVWLTDAAGYCTYTSPSFLELVGIPKEQVQKFGWMHLLPTEDVKPTKDHWLRCVETGENFEREHRFRAKDGGYRHVLGIGRPVKDDEGKITGWVGFNLDITERKHAEEALLQSEQHYRLLYETMLQGVVYQDANGTIISMNPAAESILGKTPAEFLGSSSVGEEYHTIRENRTPFPGLEHPAMVSLHTGRKVQDVVMGVYNPRENCYRWINISAVPIFRTGEDKPFQVYTLFDDITEQKRAMEALTESRAKLEAALASMTDAVFISDDQGRFIEFNDAFAKFHKFKNKDECFKTLAEYSDILDVFMADGTPAPLDMWAVPRALRGETGTDVEYTLQRKDTGETWVGCYSFAPIRNEDGEIIGSVVVGRDITELKRSKEEREQLLEAVQQERDRLAALINSITDEVWFADTQKNITLINSSGQCELSICAEDQIEIEKLTMILEVYCSDGSTRPVEEAPLLRALQGEVVKNQEEIIHTPVHRELRYRQVSASPVHNTDGNIIGSVSVIRDITESRKAGEKIKNLANIVESSNDAIITKSLDGIITSWNKGAEQIYGYSAKEVLGKPISIIEPDGLKGDIKQLGKMIEQGEKIHDYETSRLRKDGTIIDVSITLSPVFDASEKLVAISAISRDITERKKAEETLAKIEIARKQEIHHRIKNNLQVISSLLDLQADKFRKKECIKDSEVLEAFRESQDRVISMALIHEELYKGGGFETLNFSPYIEKLADNLLLTYRLGNTDISLNMDLEENLLFDMDVAVPLGIIVNELVSNSLKHAFIGKDEGEIKIELFREKSIEFKSEECESTNFTLKISDNGVGIPELEIENLDSLGMQLVTSLVDQLDGELELKRDNGTEFIIRFTVEEK